MEERRIQIHFGRMANNLRIELTGRPESGFLKVFILRTFIVQFFNPKFIGTSGQLWIEIHM